MRTDNDRQFRHDTFVFRLWTSTVFVFRLWTSTVVRKLAGASHEVIKVLLPAAERWLHRLGQEGRKLRRVSPMAQITASPETETSQPVLLSSGDPEASRLLSRSKLT